MKTNKSILPYAILRGCLQNKVEIKDSKGNSTKEVVTYPAGVFFCNLFTTTEAANEFAVAVAKRHEKANAKPRYYDNHINVVLGDHAKVLQLMEAAVVKYRAILPSSFAGIAVRADVVNKRRNRVYVDHNVNSQLPVYLKEMRRFSVMD